MSIVWTDDLAGIDWDELSELYRIAPLGNKAPGDLALVFRNSMYRAFAREDRRIVGAGRVLADGRDCAVLASTFVVESPKAKEGDGAPDAFAPQVKVSGKGEGTTLFAHGEGRPAGANNTLKIDVDAQFQDPSGGGEMSLKAALQVRQDSRLRCCVD